MISRSGARRSPIAGRKQSKHRGDGYSLTANARLATPDGRVQRDPINLGHW